MSLPSAERWSVVGGNATVTDTVQGDGQSFPFHRKIVKGPVVVRLQSLARKNKFLQ